MKLSTTLAVAITAVLVTVGVSALLQDRPDIVIDSRILSLFREIW